MARDILGFLGGTGPQGRGLAGRFAAAGLTVLLGSRAEHRGRNAAAELSAELGVSVSGGLNEKVARAANIVFVVVPYPAQRETLLPLADMMMGKLVVHCVNHMLFDERGPFPGVVLGGSAAEECEQLLPGANVVSAFHDISARALANHDQPMDADVLMCGDNDKAKQKVIELAERIPGLRGVDCGPLRLSQAVEDLTPVLVSINKRYRTHASLKITGL